MDRTIARILRVHREPCRRLGNEEIHEALTADPAGYLDHLDRALEEIAAGTATLEHPPKLLFDDPPPGGDFRVMPCVVRRPGGVTKTVKVVGTNLAGDRVPDQVTVGRAVRLDPEENFVTHLLDACLLSSARTGACGVLGLRRLAPDVETVGIVGAGRVGYYAGRYAAAAGALELRIHDRDPDRADRLARLLASAERDTSVRTAASLAEADGDAVVLATTSRDPFCSPDDLEAGLVVSLGADTREQRELAADWASAADLYVDVADSVAVGDLRAWRAAGALADGRATDLLTVYREGPAAPGRRRIFVSTGAALFDNLTIDYLLAGDAG